MMHENGTTDAELRTEMTRTAYNRYLRYGVATNALLSDTNPIAGYLGLIHQAKVGCKTQTVGVVSIEDVLNLIVSLPEKHRRNGVLLMNENTLLGLYKQCMAQGTNLWFGRTNDGKDDTIFGYRIVRCFAMQVVETGNMPILFGDFKKAYINDCGKRGVKRMHALYAVNDHVGFMLGERVGIKLMVPDAIKGLRVA